MLKCQHVEQRADALVDGTPLTWRERLALRTHLLMCRHCRRYLRQLRALVARLRTRSEPLSDQETAALLDRVTEDSRR